MGVALSVLPTTGIALPFFSYGGSALLSTMCICGVILSVSRRARL
ncbi:MAG TPA: FtsW/RodA/SpoVE family cell cycle protein [Deltaproteobacteria bacterium]|nr:FtsW/RodA/SpoVE family cell cycle protein [Deltaproteobacteria bacterium]